VALYFDPTYVPIRERSYFLPNVKLHPKQDRTQQNRDGWQTMRGFVLSRMDDQLITDDALNLAVRMSGGLFRELARIIQDSILDALSKGKAQVEKEHVSWATAQIRNEFRRLLTSDNRRFLLKIRQNQEMCDPDRLMPLLHLLAVFCDKENKCDTHPVLDPILDDLAQNLKSKI